MRLLRRRRVADAARLTNRPGLDALRYRVGTYATFLATMKARLSADELRGLERLTRARPNDPAIALLDAWATVADVLTFYQERIANEGYLRTATERRSMLELGAAGRLRAATRRRGQRVPRLHARSEQRGRDSRGQPRAKHARSRRAAAVVRDERAARGQRRLEQPQASPDAARRS